MIWGRNKLSFWGANKGLLSKPRAPGALECQRHGGGSRRIMTTGRKGTHGKTGTFWLLPQRALSSGVKVLLEERKSPPCKSHGICKEKYLFRLYATQWNKTLTEFFLEGFHQYWLLNRLCKFSQLLVLTVCRCSWNVRLAHLC